MAIVRWVYTLNQLKARAPPCDDVNVGCWLVDSFPSKPKTGGINDDDFLKVASAQPM
jgi:hypothetical protein